MGEILIESRGMVKRPLSEKVTYNLYLPTNYSYQLSSPLTINLNKYRYALFFSPLFFLVLTL